MEVLECYQLKQCNSLIIALLFQVFVFVEMSPFSEYLVRSQVFFVIVQIQARRDGGSSWLKL